MEVYDNKYVDENISDPRDVTNVIFQHDIPERLQKDFSEPSVLNIALNLDTTKMNMLSQGTMT
jgi:hypothetical protein